MPNILDPQFDQIRDEADGFLCRRAFVGRQLGCMQLGASVWDVPPGQAAYPYHWHVSQEEVLFVLAGRPTLRTPDGTRELEPGEAVAFPAGEPGAHQLSNRTGESVRLLVISPVGGAEVCVYPDSGKIGAFDDAPAAGSGVRHLSRVQDGVGYYDGEEPPATR